MVAKVPDDLVMNLKKIEVGCESRENGLIFKAF